MSVLALKTRLDKLIVLLFILWLFIPVVIFANRFGKAVDKKIKEDDRRLAEKAEIEEEAEANRTMADALVPPTQPQKTSGSAPDKSGRSSRNSNNS
jgi:hypothetical protein